MSSSSDLTTNVPLIHRADLEIKQTSSSTAGAGSGEFHTYGKLRKKQMMREEQMELEWKQERAEKEFNEKEKEEWW